jgi:CRISPR-associated protein Cmr3
MPTWYIEPRDPLIVRDGRPFGPDPGARARSIGFPAPSTTTGGLRGRAGLKKGAFDRSQQNIDRVMNIAVRGPLLAALTEDGASHTLLPSAPTDALLLDLTDEERTQARQIENKHRPDARLMRLLPLEVPAGVSFSSPHHGSNLALIGPQVAISAKPLSKPPRFWYWKTFEAWLTNPGEGVQHTADIGIAGPTNEFRTHVSVNPRTQTAEEGKLFQTSGLEFTTEDRTRLALVIESSEHFPEEFANGGFAPLGGERRLVAWRANAPHLPNCPSAIRERIIRERACRLVLLTPAHFTQGYYPTWLLAEDEAVTAMLAAALVQRPQVISGWDMAAERRNAQGRTIYGAPKPTRRLAPAGSVYFLTLPTKTEQPDDAKIGAWIDTIWMQNVSDGEQDRRDGFGLAALGTWDGKLRTMEVQ